MRASGALAIALAAAAALFVSSTASPQDGPLFHLTEKPGTHGVGLKVVEQYDYSRTYRRATDKLGKPYQGERARPLQTLIWYPAAKGGKPMTVGDYGNLAASEINFDKPKISAQAKEWLEGMAPTLSMPMWAVRDAAAAQGRFPVLIYAPSFSATSWENADLCEYLASYGYVVVASPDLGAKTRNMTGDVAGIDAQARDISFLIGYARTLTNTNMEEVAVAGFSWGGISNMFAAARDSRIDALVALDGSLRYWSGLTQQAGDVDPSQMSVPLLYFAQGEFTMEDQARQLSPAQMAGPNALNAWTHGDLVLVRMLGMTHQEYSSMYQRNEDVWKNWFPVTQKADYGREDGIAGYAWMVRYTRQFLDAYLKHDPVALAFLKRTPAQNGAPPHFLTVKFRAASGPPASFDGFRSEIGRQGFERAPEILAALQKQKADFKLDEHLTNEWAEELVDDNRFSEAIILRKLNVQMHPQSPAAQASLGDVYRKAGQKALAIDSYRKALEANPEDPDTRQKLKDMEKRHD